MEDFHFHQCVGIVLIFPVLIDLAGHHECEPDDHKRSTTMMGFSEAARGRQISSRSCTRLVLNLSFPRSATFRRDY